MNIYAYCRVSTTEQNLDRQIEAINSYCKDNNIEPTKWYEDKASGKTFERTNYLAMKEEVQKDDVIIIKELDRFGRSMTLIKEEWQYFMNKGVKIIVIDMPLISSDLSGKKTLDMQFISNLVFEVLCYSAEKEREKISQRTKEGIKAAAKKGKTIGRPVKYELTSELEEKILSMYWDMPKTEILSELGLSNTVYSRMIKQLKAKGKIKGRKSPWASR
jgi:DNA invertase Pin-like site-specific DNA recombinase